MRSTKYVDLYSAEKIGLALSIATLIVALMIIAHHGLRLDVPSFHLPLAAFAFLFPVAQFYRQTQRSARIADTLCSCAIFILFTNSGLMLNHALLSFKTDLIDHHLFAIDHIIGFDWKIFTESIAEFTLLNRLLPAVYNSSISQRVFIILLLGFMGMTNRLHHFLLTGIFASLASISIWSIIPSFGPSAYIQLSSHIDAQLGRVFDAHMGQLLLDLHANGPSIISTKNQLGLIAFPSMHTVMALMSVWHTRGTPAFWGLLPLNLLMIPAILIHGGHHLIDMVAGAIVFTVCCGLASALLPNRDPAVKMSKATRSPNHVLTKTRSETF